MSVEAIDPRLRHATEWVRSKLDDSRFRLEPISGDASFRRYFRIHRGDGGESLVLMDAPPEQEDSKPFLDVAERLRAAGLHAPEVLHFDLEKGFGILEDLGDRLYREKIDETSVDHVFPDLFGVLATMAGKVSRKGLRPYDRALLQQEMDLFPDWYLTRHKIRPLTTTQRKCWEAACQVLVDNALEQPQVFVHRDFHSCNLMWRNGKDPGVIDFQDAVEGPLSYDFISLIWDRYVHWPRARLESWMSDMHTRLQPGISPAAWVRHCDLMGLQRNLKVVGIFARLRHRDGKQGYIEMIPMFYRYVLDVLPRYPDFDEFRSILEEHNCAP